MYILARVDHCWGQTRFLHSTLPSPCQWDWLGGEWEIEYLHVDYSGSASGAGWVEIEYLHVDYRVPVGLAGW